MNTTTMEEFFFKTRPFFEVYDCQMGTVNCKYDWKVIGTLKGMCLSYSPTQKYPRDVELRVTLGGNKTGNLGKNY